jgi:type I restriction enzyme S subunit
MCAASETITKWKPYPKYKDSGFGWVKQIPDHWEIWKLSHAFKRIGSGTTPSTDNIEYYDGIIPWVTTSELRENMIKDTASKLTEEALKHHTTLSLYPIGTLLVAMYGATIGRLGILGVPACTNQACCAFADSDVLDNRFLFYSLLMRKQDIIMMSSGGGQPNINQDKLRSFRIAAPKILEQHTIAAFLDRETAMIDALITKKERLIDLLQEKRAAVISHAVTRGLDPSVPMKDSEVEYTSITQSSKKVC